MKRMIQLLLLVPALGLASCSPEKQSTAPGDRLKWNVATLKEDYDRVGRKNPKWNQAAGQALNEFARVRNGQATELDDQLEYIGQLAGDSVQAGCDDPLVRYLYCRFAPGFSRLPLSDRQNELRQTAASMEGSGYSPIRKFYVDIRASNVLWENHDTNLWPEVHSLRMAAINELSWALNDKTLPVEEAGQACELLLDSTASSQYQLTNAYNAIEVPLFKNWPHTAVACFIQAKFFYEWAWKARGNGYANQVSADAWKSFSGRLNEAEKELKQAWRLNPRDEQVPTLMIKVVEGLQRDRSEMEMWFNRAMDLNPDNYAACSGKLHYLYPQWYGSREDMLEFGRQCVQSTNWGGDVPLILVDAHFQCARNLPQDERANYWQLPDVWPDIQAAYSKFFQLNPEAKRIRNYYARYAYTCGQWKVFNEQIALLDPVDYDFFGGKEKFDRMTAQAREAAGANP